MTKNFKLKFLEDRSEIRQSFNIKSSPQKPKLVRETNIGKGIGTNLFVISIFKLYRYRYSNTNYLNISSFTNILSKANNKGFIYDPLFTFWHILKGSLLKYCKNARKL